MTNPWQCCLLLLSPLKFFPEENINDGVGLLKGEAKNQNDLPLLAGKVAGVKTVSKFWKKISTVKNRRGSLTHGLWNMPGSPVPELEKGFCYHQSCARAVSSCLWAKDGRSRWREGWGGVSAGLVSAGGSAIHTTQMQVDEVTVIRLSPIVYNKELVKTELLSQIPTLAPNNQSNIWERHRNKKRANRRQAATRGHTHIYIYKHYMSAFLWIYTYMYTHTNISQTYILGRWRENFQQAGKDSRGEKSRSLHRDTSPICVCSSTCHWCLSCSCWEKQN